MKLGEAEYKTLNSFRYSVFKRLQLESDRKIISLRKKTLVRVFVPPIVVTLVGGSIVFVNYLLGVDLHVLQYAEAFTLVGTVFIVALVCYYYFKRLYRVFFDHKLYEDYIRTLDPDRADPYYLDIARRFMKESLRENDTSQ